MSKACLILICWLGIVAVYGLPTESNTTAVSDLKTAGSSPQNYYSSSLSDWRTGLGQVLVIVAVIVSGLALLGGSAYLLAPVFGYRSCSVFGTCEKSGIANSPGGNLQDPSVHANAFNDMQSYGYYPNTVGYRKKRSIERSAPSYVKPMRFLSTMMKLFENENEATLRSGHHE